MDRTASHGFLNFSGTDRFGLDWFHGSSDFLSSPRYGGCSVDKRRESDMIVILGLLIIRKGSRINTRMATKIPQLTLILHHSAITIDGNQIRLELCKLFFQSKGRRIEQKKKKKPNFDPSLLQLRSMKIRSMEIKLGLIS